MADFYSSHFGPAEGETGHVTTKSVPNPLVGAGERHGRVRHSHARILFPVAMDMADNDIVMLFSIKSSDRIGELLVYHDAGFGANMLTNVGLFKLKSDNSTGDEVDEDLFMANYERAGAITRADATASCFAQAALADTDRWKPAWQLAAIGLAAYTEDPVEDWVVTMSAHENVDVPAAPTNFNAEIFYKSGD